LLDFDLARQPVRPHELAALVEAIENAHPRMSRIGWSGSWCSTWAARRTWLRSQSASWPLQTVTPWLQPPHWRSTQPAHHWGQWTVGLCPIPADAL